MRKIRVLIVEDSRVIRESLEHIISQDPRLEIADIVGSAEEALRILDRVAADVISMDIWLPGVNGFEATRKIMEKRPTPIVVVSASVDDENLRITMNALQAGALTVLEKPAGTVAEYEAFAERLCTQLAIMSQVKVVRQRNITVATRPLERHNTWSSCRHRMLGIVTSTGGPNAVSQILRGLGPEFPLPILLVQHITENFLEGFASWLESVSPFSVVLVKDSVAPVAGTVYLAGPDRHLRLERGALLADSGDPVSAQRPSGTVLFESMAKSLGTGALGVLLTGMGQDGAAGLLQIRNRGGHTIAEHESTAVVYGMPGEAARLGAVCESLPLPSIAPRILELALSEQEVA
jgi:two-component system chemotaxis response regulator CheB